MVVESSFNPLPSPKQGETSGVAEKRVEVGVSIRSPHRSKGRQVLQQAAVGGDGVSIRSPHRSKGRLSSPLASMTAEQFQSAPLTEARGDTAAVATAAGLIMFQSAPLTEARGDAILAPFALGGRCFNPLPSPKQGETGCRRRWRRRLGVSIRSPHRSKGRLWKIGDLPHGSLFQSAPLTEARGDGYSLVLPCGFSCFNPLPSPKQGETLSLRLSRLEVDVSIRSPHRSKGRHVFAV